MSEKLFLYVWNFLLPAVLIPFGIPMIFRKVKPNNFYGFRTGKTLSDEAIWYDANARAGKGMVIAGIVTLIGLSILLPFNGYFEIWPFNIIGWCITLIPLIVAVVDSFVYLRKL